MQPTVEQSEAQMNVAVKSPEHLQAWLEATGRDWLVFNTKDLVDALPWPDGVDVLINFCRAYRDHRATKPTGDEELVPTPEGDVVPVPVFHGERLTVIELDRAIRYLVGQASQLDPSWSLEGSPL